MQNTSRFLLGLFGMLFQVVSLWAQPECGNYDMKEKHLPWTANLYRLNRGSYEFVCAGTIISKSVILTAAHCFYDDTNQRRWPGQYFLTSGQQSTAWNVGSKPDVQVRKLPPESITIHNKYKGIKSYYSDNIAIIKLTDGKHLNINKLTKSACIDWDNEFVETEIERQTPPLQVTTWNASKNGIFNLLQPTYVIYGKCFDLLPEEFQPFLTSDKMCAQTEGILTTPCNGSGLYAYNKNKNRWFLIGIGSEIKPVGSRTLLSFTKIQSHMNWLSNNVFLLLDQ